MRWIQQMRMRFQMLFHRGTAAARLDDELQDHLERQVAQLASHKEANAAGHLADLSRQLISELGRTSGHRAAET